MVLDDTQSVMEECAGEVLVEGGKVQSVRIIRCDYPE